MPKVVLSEQRAHPGVYPAPLRLYKEHMDVFSVSKRLTITIIQFPLLDVTVEYSSSLLEYQSHTSLLCIDLKLKKDCKTVIVRLLWCCINMCVIQLHGTIIIAQLHHYNYTIAQLHHYNYTITQLHSYIYTITITLYHKLILNFNY